MLKGLFVLCLWALSHGQYYGPECATKGNGNHDCIPGETCLSDADCILGGYDCLDLYIDGQTFACDYPQSSDCQTNDDCAYPLMACFNNTCNPNNDSLACTVPCGNPLASEECGYCCENYPWSDGCSDGPSEQFDCVDPCEDKTSFGCLECCMNYEEAEGCPEISSTCSSGGTYSACCNPSSFNGGDCMAYCSTHESTSNEPACKCYSTQTYAACCEISFNGVCDLFCGANCKACKDKGKTNLCSAGYVCGDYCRPAGTGILGSVCGTVGDADCQATLSCKGTGENKICGGNGTLGAHCYDYDGNDSPCVNAYPVCEYRTTQTCRAVGTGGNGQPCGYSGDADCNNGLACDNGDEKCRAVGNGGNGQSCGSQGDSDCNNNGLCDFLNWTCRAPGTGGNDQPCGDPSDSHCNNGLTCDPLYYKCRAAGTGGSGQPCGSQSDASCSGTMICDTTTKKCRSNGNGAYQAGCGGSGDSPCTIGLLCSSGKCVGSGASGAKCAGTGDAPCATGITCDSVAGKCRFPGSGASGEKCGSTGDAACVSGSCNADQVCGVAGNNDAADSIFIPSFLIALLFALLLL